MRTLTSSVLWGGVLACVCLLTGCVLRQNTVVSRFSGEFVCPERQVQVLKTDKDRFQATGCNRRANYRCTGEYGELCERIGQPETINNTPSDTPPEVANPAQPDPTQQEPPGQ